MSKYARGEALWVKYFEDAFRLYKLGGNITTSDSEVVRNYIEKWIKSKQSEDILDGGTSDIVLTAITGKTSYSIALKNDTADSQPGNYSSAELAVYNTIRKKLEKNLAVTAGKSGKTEDEHHMYSVVGAEKDKNGKLIIELYNPHGKFQVFFIDEFVKKFKVLNVESRKQKCE